MRAAPSLSALIGMMMASILHANPKAGTVTNGAITITETPGVMTINQTTPRGIIHWQDFSIGAGELTQFQHLDAKSATLNRVVGAIPSTIQGTLQANGQIYLVNPNGILVGPTGRVNTAAFVASTLDVPDAAFLAGGDMRFTGPSLQGVVNLGTITATDGDVILMARNVVNAGSINAPNGVAALAAGNDILLQAAGDERIVVNSGIAAGGSGAENSGSISAAQAELKAAGGNVYALAVNNTGVVRATGIAQKNGRIILSSNGGVVQNSGQLIAKNADGSGGSVKLDSGKGGSTTNNGSIDASADNATKNGGTVELLGDTVTVGGSSVINVNGLNAGTVAIGVSAQIANQTTEAGGIATLIAAAPAAPLVPGAPAPVSTAQQTTIQKNSRIMANSTSSGNGGRVVVWSEKQSVVGGVIEAKGGDLGGNGGLVETSGKTGLTIVPDTKVNTAAPKGTAGQWLLDPAGINIVGPPATTNATTAGGPAPTAVSYTQNLAVNTVAANDILAALLGGSNVTVKTTGFPLSADIVVNADLPLTGLFLANFLSFDSAGGITVNKVVGGPTSNISLSFKAANGNIAFAGTGAAQVSSAGTVFLDTHLSSSATITNSSANVVQAGKLDITSGRQGIGTSANPFFTSVSNLEATVASNAQTTGGGVFIKNSGTSLHIGGVDPSLNGVQVSNLPGFGGIEITHTGGTLFLDSATGERVTAPGSIKLTNTGGDINVSNINANGVHSHFGTATLDAAFTVNIGDGSGHSGFITGNQGVTIKAGLGDVRVRDGSSIVAQGVNDVSITSTGGGISLQGTGSVSSSGGKINLTADSLVLNIPVNVGPVGSVNISPVGAHTAINIGTATKNVANELGISQAELNQITGGTLQIFTPSTDNGLVHVSAFTNVSSAKVPKLTLEAGGGGGVSVDQNLSLANLALTLNAFNGGNIGGSANIFANSLTALAPGGAINLTGPIGVSYLKFNAGGNALFTNPANTIATINKLAGDSSTGTVISVATALSLAVNGTLGGPASTSYIYLQTGQTGSFTDLFFGPGTQLNSTGSIDLNIHGALINYGGSGVLSSPNYRVWQADLNTQNTNNTEGGIPGTRDKSVAVSFGGNPLAPDPKVFYYAVIPPPPTPPSPPPAPPISPFQQAQIAAAAKVANVKKAIDNGGLDAVILILHTLGYSGVQDFLNKNGAGISSRRLMSVGEPAPLPTLDAKAQAFKNLTGFAPLPDASIELQTALWTRADDALDGDHVSALDMQMMLKGGAQKLTPEQVSDLSPANVWLLADRGVSGVDHDTAAYYNSIRADEYGFSYAYRVSTYAKGGGTLSPAQADKFINDGPTAVKNLGGSKIALNGMFTADKGMLSAVPALGDLAIIIPPNSMPLNGAMILLPPLAPAGTRLISQDGGGLISQDGGGLRAGKNGTLISQDGGGLISQDGGGLISQDGGG